ncbi:MAG: DUF6932 family protein [Allosphingosinicella sp.]
MIPALISVAPDAPWPVLPPGIHDATMAEVALAFATTPHRQWLFSGFQRVTDALRVAGCSVVYLDGSFTTGKPHPDDYDGCWNHGGMDFALLDPVLLDFSQKRAAQKRKFLGEMFPALSVNGPGGTFLDFFQIEKFSGQPKGIIRIFLAPKGPTP